MTFAARAIPFLALGLAAAVLAACQGNAPVSTVKPSFYSDLASPSAQVDQVKALAMINEYRAKNGSGPLRLDPELSRIAASYARVMADADQMSHSVTEDTKIGPRLRANGYAFVAAGENIAAGYRTLAEAFSGWRQSPRHDRGMKDKEMTAMGIATAYNPNSKYKVFWCLILAKPRDTLAPGVASVPTVVNAGGLTAVTVQ